MLISLHKQATTTPKVRAAIQASTEPAWMLAERHGISEQTVWKWRKRDGVHDRSHTAHRLQTTLTPAQEAVAVALRTTLLLPLDDLLAVAREFLNPHVSRSGLDRCLRRHGVGNLRELKPKVVKPAYQPFKAYEPGYLHLDVKYLPQMADEQRRRYLFVAIDRATRWVFVRVYRAKTAANARRFLRDLERTAPMKISRVLTDNGKEFTDRLFGLRRRAATGNHDFDRLCTELDIEHRLAPPRRPQTNGMAERFNGRIEDVLQSHRFRSGEDLEQTILRYVRLYNTQLPQSVLKENTPIEALKDWHRRRPELFRKQPYNHAGCDNYIYPIDIAVPRPAEQGEIAALLGALDDKIELNRRMSATLEEMARALYRSWFVDFDPVHARALGKPPAHMDPPPPPSSPTASAPTACRRGGTSRRLLLLESVF